MKKNISIFLSCLFCCSFLLAQEKEYWQQETNYEIEVSLDDEKHELNGFLRLQYINNSPDDLDEMYFHLWPNAYKNQSTAFAKQKLESGSTKFYYSKEAERGYIDGLNFKGNEKTLTLAYDETHIDICKIKLAETLKSGDTLLITTPFHVKIPESFSRLGHVGQSYQITQWYPKPAVYDAKGWHQMPYLDQGEFYSEYGTYDVKITLPKNYVVGATGDLQNQDEQKWLNEKAAETLKIETFDDKTDFPESSKEMKTLHYKQQNVHDFAFFADKRFHVLKGSVQLPNEGKNVTTWAMFTNEEAKLWKNISIEALNDAIYFYSEKSGAYPYFQATAVQSALSAGAGMEYPNVTVIGKSGTERTLERVIVHEVGHNWFYGILGSDERTHAWMDEGINTYYENRYFDEKYPDLKMLGKFAETGIARFFDLSQYKDNHQNYYMYLFNARKNEDQPIDLHAHEYTSLNYGGIVYGKAGIAFKYMEAWLGTKRFDEIMQKYYQQFEFKHPYPDDLKQLFEQETGKYLDWFFDDLIFTTKKIDYKIKNVKREKQKIGDKSYDEITLKQKPQNHLKGPFSLSALKDGEVVKTIWYDGFLGEMPVLFPTTDYDELKIDVSEVIPDVNRANNTYKMKGLTHKKMPLRLQPLGSIENYNRNQVFFMPVLGYNVYDKTMLGMAFYNSLLPVRKFDYIVMPMYAFGSKTLSGTVNAGYNWYPKGKMFQHIRLSMTASTYGNGYYDVYGNTPENRDLISRDVVKFYRFMPQLDVVLKEENKRSKVERRFTFRHVNVKKDRYDCPEGDVYRCPSVVADDYYVNEIAFSQKNKRRINPYSMIIKAQQGTDFSQISFEGNYKLSYGGGGANHGFDVRFFAGGFLQNETINENSANVKFLSTNDLPRWDYMLDDVAFGRYEVEGFTSHQLGMRNGGFKLPSSIGTSDRFLLAANFKSSMLPKIPIKLYGDIGMAITENELFFPWSGNVLFDAGLALVIVPNTFEIYLPLFHSTDFRTSFKANDTKFYEKISFYINFNSLTPIRQAREASLF